MGERATYNQEKLAQIPSPSGKAGMINPNICFCFLHTFSIPRGGKGKWGFTTIQKGYTMVSVTQS